MSFRPNARSALMLVLLGLTGCAAPIKALMGEQTRLADQSAPAAPTQEDIQLRAAMIEKGHALLRARAQQPTVANPVTKSALATAPAPRGLTPAVAAMLARARTTDAPSPKDAPSPNPAPIAAFPAAPKAKPAPVLPVKDETRFQDSPSGSLARRPDQAVIRFTPGSSELNADGNQALTDLARRSERAPAAKLVLVAGLSGRGTPWERMQVASERLEIVARHVPPALKVERRFELELENQSVRLELHRESR